MKALDSVSSTEWQERGLDSFSVNGLFLRSGYVANISFRTVGASFTLELQCCVSNIELLAQIMVNSLHDFCAAADTLVLDNQMGTQSVNI